MLYLRQGAGTTLTAQEQAGSNWARRDDAEVALVCRDIAGAPRHGLTEALRALKSGEADAIWIAGLAALAPSLAVQEAILQDLWAAGATVLVGARGAELPRRSRSTKRQEMREAIREVLAYQRELSSLRRQRGQAEKAAGGFHAYGAPPFGYQSSGGELVSEPKEQAAIARALALRADGLSLRRIADILDEEGHKPRRAEGSRPSRWHPTTLARVLKRAEASGNANQGRSR